jgi:beta-mannosidase
MTKVSDQKINWQFISSQDMKRSLVFFLYLEILYYYIIDINTQYMNKEIKILGALLFLFAVGNLPVKAVDFVSSYDIKDNWEFRQAGKEEWLLARVPGCVHTDLLLNKRIQDPYYRNNEKFAQWIDTVDWEYRNIFTANEELASKANVEFIFRGLDTYADIYLNNQLLASTDNMFRTWVIDCKKAIKQGKNELRIYFHSPIKIGLKEYYKLPYRLPASNDGSEKPVSIFTRKAPFQYGWDWGPRLITSGVWRMPSVRGWNKARMEDVFIEQKEITKEKASCIAHTEIMADKTSKIKLAIYIDDARLPVTEQEIDLRQGLNKFDLPFAITQPKLWWPNGLGDHYLYRIKALITQGDLTIDALQKRIGVRTLKVIQTPDKDGKSFYFEVNGVPVFMRGANYIPSDHFTTRVTPERYQKIIQTAVDNNMNMLRVWGGAIYENDEFYDICAEKGILIWQEFMFACSMYPGDDHFIENVRKEAEDNVKRLRNYPEIALWCGNNEIPNGWFRWGWSKSYGYSASDSTKISNDYVKLFHQVLPDVITRLNPQLFYWPSSPSSAFGVLSNGKSGDEHAWGVWFGQQPISSYNNDVPRFSSEYGMQSLPDIHTINTFSEADDQSMHSKVMDYRQKSNMPWIRKGFNGNNMIEQYVAQYYKEPNSFSTMVYLSQLMQAETLKTAIESYRRSKPHCMGSLYWQLDDTWPTISWSTLDYYLRWKAGQYFVQKAYKDVIVSPVTDSTNVSVSVISDKLTPMDAVLSLTSMNFSGKVLYKQDLPVKIEPNSSKILLTKSEQQLLGKETKNNVVIHVALTSGTTILSENNLYLVKPANLKLPKNKVKFQIEHRKGGYNITLSSKTLLKNVYIYTDNADATFSDNYFDLLPGETKVVEYAGMEPMTTLQSAIRISSLADSY